MWTKGKSYKACFFKCVNITGALIKGSGKCMCSAPLKVRTLSCHLCKHLAEKRDFPLLPERLITDFHTEVASEYWQSQYNLSEERHG